ncbi:unnamed protein product [Aureobasidium mustum]|uniref:Uncharacterized protein n=1 Tax=Aureobasidium mustum TaxID=2773714 RepID=A0A9N8JPY5_9PEZI|nr:unnamed protein product [Aureobasidium mustum]
MSDPIIAGIARLSLANGDDDDDDGGVRLSRSSSPRPETPPLVTAHASDSHGQPERAGTASDGSSADVHSAALSSVTPAAISSVPMSHHDMAVASLTHADNVQYTDEVRNAITRGFYHVRDWRRLQPGWTPRDSNLVCTHTGLGRGRDRVIVEPPTCISHSQMFGRFGVLLCEDGRSSECRLWHRNLLHCHQCNTWYCLPCAKLHRDPKKVNAKQRQRPSTLKRKTARAAKFGAAA